MSIIDAAAVDTRRGRPAEELHLLVVPRGALAHSPFLRRAVDASVQAGWATSLATTSSAERDDVAWYRLPSRRRATSQRLHQLAAQADLVLVEPSTLPMVQRARTRTPVVMLVDEELLGSRSAMLRAGKIDLAIASSETVAGPLRWRGVETVVVAPPHTTRATRDLEPDNTIGCAMRVDAGAGLDVLLDAFASLGRERDDLRLEVVQVDGTQDTRVLESAVARAARPDLDGRVRFLDANGDHRDVVARWRVVVHPPITAQSENDVLRDAVALGVPVVTTNRGEPAAPIGRTGVFVRPGRADELARGIARALDDPAIAERARQEVLAAQHATPITARADAHAEADLVDVLAGAAERGARRRAGIVVFVVPDFEPTLGGTTRQTQNQARELRARGYDVEVLTQRLEPQWPRSEIRDGLRVRRVTPSGRTFLRMKLLVLSVSRWLRRHRDDIAVVNVIMYPDFVVSAVLAGLGPRTVMCWAGLGDATDTIGTKGPLRAPLRAVRRRALSSAAQVALTPALHDELDRLGLGRDVSVIPTPVDIGEFRPPTAEQRTNARQALGIDPDDLVIAYTGHLRALKRVERLVEAFDRLIASGRPARLLLVGSSRDDFVDPPTAFFEALERSPARDRVLITGAVSDVRPYLHAADTFVLPSDREGLSNSVLEALASGLPVVAPPSAAGDQVLDDTCGIIPPSNDPRHLFEALTRLADDPAFRASLAKGAREAAERFGLARVVNEYESLYTRLQWRAAVR